ncbi:MAG: deoxyguanosinetriphosphate triphosphohydrolase [Beijerinckiaceae bacterium]|nr:deoxyguanosinetriphosphate triphosphohydrolase [Beijerinckiaceae bacterium]
MSRGRLHPEPSSPTRSEFQRDRDRIIHSSAFRRLKHKTQVFIEHEGDHHRTRLTHSLEVAQIARSIARALGLDEDLAEALALAHDLGHTPFGHTGEDALDAVMAPYRGFDHNAQTLRIVTSLERRYAAFDGLNLTWETLEGLAKHNGAVTDKEGNPVGRYTRFGVPFAIVSYNQRQDLELATLAGAEAQAAAIADDIAYDAHDIDDGLRAGLFEIDELREVPHLASLLDDIEDRHGDLEPSRTIHELQRRVITRFVEDVIAESETRLTALKPQRAQDIRLAGAPVIAFSARMAAADRSIKGFLFPHMYRHETVVRIRVGATQIVTDLFERFMASCELLPSEWQAGLVPGDEMARARHIADYIAGMTDRYAIQAHQQLFDATPDLR